MKHSRNTHFCEISQDRLKIIMISHNLPNVKQSRTYIYKFFPILLISRNFYWFEVFLSQWLFLSNSWTAKSVWWQLFANFFCTFFLHVFFMRISSAIFSLREKEERQWNYRDYSLRDKLATIMMMVVIKMVTTQGTITNLL